MQGDEGNTYLPEDTRIPSPLSEAERKDENELLKRKLSDALDLLTPARTHRAADLVSSADSSMRLLNNVWAGTITLKPAIQSADCSEVTFLDGTAANVTLLAEATGCRPHFPFFAKELLGVGTAPQPLVQNVIPRIATAYLLERAFAPTTVQIVPPIGNSTLHPLEPFLSPCNLKKPAQPNDLRTSLHLPRARNRM